MTSKTDDLESFVITGGVLTVTSGPYGPGDIEIAGSLYSNKIFENTDGLGVDVEDVVFSNKTVLMSDVPTVTQPGLSGKYLMYFDATDQKLKSIDSAGVITVYQPLTTKGDLVVHNGTTEVRLPSGTNGQVLTVNSSSSSGVEWANGGSVAGTSKQNVTTIYFSGTSPVILNNIGFSSNVYSITPNVENGASLNYLVSKNNPASGSYNAVKLNTNNSIGSNANFNSTYAAYKGFTVVRNYTEGVGEYEIFTNANYTKYAFTLSGTTATALGSPLNTTSGAFFISIQSTTGNAGAPSGNYILLKNNASSNSFLVNTLSSSPGTGGNAFSFTWPSNSGISISKTVSGNGNGGYTFVDNFESTNLQTTISLSGTSSVIIPNFYYYDKKSCFLKVTPVNASSQGPSAVYFVSKNLNTRTGNITRVSQPGVVSGTQLNLTWAANSLLSISKSNINYSEDYLVTFSH